jgi:hypothetical protein
MDTLETTVQRMNATVGQAPALVAMVGDVVDEGMRHANAAGINLEARLLTALQLFNRLTEPHVAGQLTHLLDLADQAPGFLAMAGDMVDDAYRSANTAGIDMETLVKQSGVAAQRLSDLMCSPEFTTLMDSGMLDPNAVRLLGSAATALVKSQQASEPIGPLGLLGALRDPDVQKALGFFLTFAKEFGKHIR